MIPAIVKFSVSLYSTSSASHHLQQLGHILIGSKVAWRTRWQVRSSSFLALLSTPSCKNFISELTHSPSIDNDSSSLSSNISKTEDPHGKLAARYSSKTDHFSSSILPWMRLHVITNENLFSRSREIITARKLFTLSFAVDLQFLMRTRPWIWTSMFHRSNHLTKTNSHLRPLVKTMRVPSCLSNALPYPSKQWISFLAPQRRWMMMLSEFLILFLIWATWVPKL